MISMCACCGLYGERIEYCGPLVRAGTQYNATTCPARAGLIPRPAPTHWGRGTISACAERSRRPVEQVRVERDHLRVCGAVSDSVNREHDLMRSSPRVRSGPKPETKGSACLGIISACAERSQSSLTELFDRWDHLRVCGAVSCILLGFGPVGWCGMFDSYVVRGRGVALFSIFGMDAFDICYAR